MAESRGEETGWQRIYRDESRQLGQIGRALSELWSDGMPTLEVRLPVSLADMAVRAWERPGDETAGANSESFEQRVHRHRAGTLGLIGLAIKEGGRWEGGHVVVALPPDLIGVALDAVDDLPAT